MSSLTKFLIIFAVVFIGFATLGGGFYFLYASQQNIAFKEQLQIAQLQNSTATTKASGDVLGGILGVVSNVLLLF